jgi:16S rRNA (cytosine967-C5)-methyltransferase
MIPFRDYHLLSLLEGFENSKLPLDLFISLYFKDHKALGSKDRAYISDTVYALIRHLGLIDQLVATPSWSLRLDCYKKLEPIEEKNFPSLPLHHQVSYPKNLFDLICKNYGIDQAISLCKICNTKAPTTVRVNTLKIDRDSLLQKWQNEYKVIPCSQAKNGITFLEKIHFFSLPEFKLGYFEIQDEASQLVSELLDIQEGDLVLDYCAGAGGKSLAIAPYMRGSGQLFLHDIRKKALLDAKERLKRAGVQNYQILFNDEEQKQKKLKKKINKIFVDAPCSGTGTLRRNPDMKWRFKEEDLKSLIGEQRNIFEKALSFLAPKGLIVYATCSLLNEENEEQTAHFAKTYNLEVVKTFKSLPSIGGMDGFYAACFKKENLVK